MRKKTTRVLMIIVVVFLACGSFYLGSILTEPSLHIEAVEVNKNNWLTDEYLDDAIDNSLADDSDENFSDEVSDDKPDNSEPDDSDENVANEDSDDESKQNKKVATENDKIIIPKELSLTLEENLDGFVTTNPFTDPYPVSLNGNGLLVYKKALYLFDEKTGDVALVCEDNVKEAAFDGQTVFFTTSKKDYEVELSPDYQDWDGLIGEYHPISFTRSDIMKYDMNKKSIQKVFTTYGEVNQIAFFDSKELYYLDIPESEIGYNHDYNSDLNLYSYNFATKKISSVIAKAREVNPICIGNQHFLLMKGQDIPLQIYDLNKKKLIELKTDDYIDIWQFNCQWFAKDTIYFTTLGSVGDDFGVYMYAYHLNNNLFERIDSFKDLSYLGPRYYVCGEKSHEELNEDGTVETIIDFKTYYDLNTGEVFDLPYENSFSGMMIKGISFGLSTTEENGRVLTCLDDNYEEVDVLKLPDDFELSSWQNEYGYYEPSQQDVDWYDFVPYPIIFEQ